VQQAEELKQRQLNAMARDEDHKIAQLAEKHAQQLQSFRSQAKQMLKDLREHYATALCAGPEGRPLPSTARRRSSKATAAETSAAKGKQAAAAQAQQQQQQKPKPPRRSKGLQRSQQQPVARTSRRAPSPPANEDGEFGTMLIEHTIGSGAQNDLGTVMFGTAMIEDMRSRRQLGQQRHGGDRRSLTPTSRRLPTASRRRLLPSGAALGPAAVAGAGSS
jgi:hypothetical protein